MKLSHLPMPSDDSYFLYGVFIGTRFGLTRSIDAALRFADANPGAEIRVTVDSDIDGCPSWDYPTFHALSAPVAHYSPWTGWETVAA